MTNKNGRKQLIEDIMESFHSIKRKLVGNIPTEKKLGMTASQMMILHFIEKNKAVNIKDVAAEFKMTSSAATQQVAGLIKMGLLTREHNSNDRREIFISLSKKASQHEYARIRQQIFSRISSAFAILNDAELTQFYKLHKKVADSLNNKN